MVLSLFSLSGRRAVVTGASRGLGRALAVGLAEAGARVLCVARGQKSLDETVELIRGAGGSAESMSVDLMSPDAPERVVGAAVQSLGGLDVLVNNAGSDFDGPIEGTSLPVWEQIQCLNVTAAFLMCKAASQHLQADGGGKVINVASIMGHVGARDNAAYVASKHGLVGFTRGLALEWARRGVQVNVLAPGFLKTEMTEHMHADEAATAWVRKRTPMGRWGDASDFVGSAVFLASAASDFMTGQSLVVDGGWTAQ